MLLKDFAGSLASRPNVRFGVQSLKNRFRGETLRGR